MGARLQDKIDLFYGGMSDDIRIQQPEVFAAATHFDIFTYPKRLVPYRAMEANETTSYNIQNFVFAEGKLYGLGIVAASSKVKIYEKASDAIADSWTASSSAEDTLGSRATQPFTAFHKYIYGLTGGTRLWAWGDITGTPSFTATAASVSYSRACKGIITSDDLFLQPYDNKIARKNGAGSGPTDAWTVAALTLPDSYIITDIVETGDLVAIACRPTNQVLNSKVYLWDKVNEDVLDVIDWGEGSLYILDEVEGELVGISQQGGIGSISAVKPKLTVRRWSSGRKARVAFEIEDEATTLTVYGNHTKIKDGSRIIFGLRITLGGVAYHQLASVGRKTESYPLVFNLDRKIDNDTAISSIDGVYNVAGYVFAAHNNDGSVNRTNDDSTVYTATSIYISQKINGGHVDPDAVRKTKKLAYVGLRCAPLGSGDSLSLYYRINAETAWTLIRTYTNTANPSGLGFEAGNQNDGNEFRSAYEFQFKVESTGGAEPTSIEYGFDVGEASSSA